MSVAIEKNIPIPETRGVQCKYPWQEMEIGDSFFVEGKKKSSLYPQACAAAQKYQRKFTCRDIDGGVRVWRTA